MAALRQNVFVEKVLKRLYANAPCGQGKRTLETPASVGPPEKAAAENNVACRSVAPRAADGAADGSTTAPPGRRLYTVSLPPDGHLPVWPERPCSPGPVSSSSSEAETTDQDLHDQPKRRRIRKRKSKRTYENSLSDVPADKADLEKQCGLSWKKLQSCHTDGPAMSKNKRRKLKKKQQIKRKKAAGLLTSKTSGVNFLYQPEEGSSEPGDQDEVDGPDLELGVGIDIQEPGADLEPEVGTEAREQGPGLEPEVGTEAREQGPGLEPEVGTEAREQGPGLEPEVGTEASEEGVSRTDKKADDILTFLKSTQELYFYDGATRDSEFSVSVESAAQFLKHLETHSLPCSDLLSLDHMKTLLLLEDTVRLKHALEVFPEHCLMPPDHARVISAFFSYWITHVLPEKNTNSE